MFSAKSFSANSFIFLKAIVAVILLLAIDATSALHSENDQENDPFDTSFNEWVLAVEYQCPSTEILGNCSCTLAGDQLFLNCSNVKSEGELALVFQQDFPTKYFTQFDLSNNPNIRELGPISNEVSFERIYLDFNENLEMISDEFLLTSWNTLQFLQIRYSKLHRASFPFAMLPFFSELETLNIENSELLTSLPKLESASLREASFLGSAISTLEPDTFDGLPQLEQLSLVGNELTTLAAGSVKLTDKLANIYLYENSMETIEPGAFISDATNGTLETLVIDLSPNQLVELRAGTFPLPDSPAFLILSNNMINTIRPGAFLLPATRDYFYLVLSLENNQLTTLDEEVFGYVFPYLENIYLYNNPLNCGCDIAWIILNRDYMRKIDDVTSCADGVLLHDLNPEDYEMFC